MPADAWQTLAELIERGDVDGVVAALEALDESARVKLSTRVQKAARAIETRDWQRAYAQRLAASTALFGTAGAAVAARAWPSPAGRPELGARLLAVRPRGWRQDWAERALERRDDVFSPEWKTVRAAVRAGLIDRPAAVGYVTGAVEGMRDAYDPPRPPRPLADMLRDDPDWLRDELWHLFEIEDAALTGRDVWGLPDQSWSLTLLALAREGVIARERLLDESLAALRRDFAPYAARWYHRFYEALEPTRDEQVQRLDVLLALLASEDTSVVAFALRALGPIERGGRLPPDALIEAIAPALMLPVKGHAVRAVKLLGRVLKRSPEHARVAAQVLTAALAHESRDVQEAVLDVLERHRDALGAAERERIAGLADAVDRAVRPRVAALSGAGDGSGSDAVGDAAFADPADDSGRSSPVAGGDAARVAGPAMPIPGLRPIARDAPRLAAARPLVPPAAVGELFDRMAIALERGDDPDELELMLDGLGRLPVGGGDRGRERALVERAVALALPSIPIDHPRAAEWLGSVGFFHAREPLAVAILRRFGTGWQRAVQLGPTGRGPREALAQRLRELLADDAPRPLLSTPTHAGGWIDPAVAVQRVAALAGRPPVLDLAQMVLRLAFDDRDRARRAAERLDGEAAAVLVLALGGEPRRPLLRRLGVAWAAAEQARDPAGYAAPTDLPLVTEEFESHMDREGKVAAASPVDLLELSRSWWGWEPGGIERWLTTVWPANREAVFHIVVRRLWINRGTREYGIGDVLETLLDPREPIGDQAALAVALAVGAADVTDRALAVDVAIAALHTRRLDGAALGALLARLLREQDAVVPARWADSLGDLAPASPLAAHDVQVAIEHLLSGATTDDRRRLLGVVELLRRLAGDADARVEHAGAREWLGAVTGRSKLARAASEALAVTGDGAGRSRDAAALVD